MTDRSTRSNQAKNRNTGTFLSFLSGNSANDPTSLPAYQAVTEYLLQKRRPLTNCYWTRSQYGRSPKRSRTSATNSRTLADKCRWRG